MKLLLIMFGVFVIMLSLFIALTPYAESKFPVKIQDVTPKDLQLLIDRARISGGIPLQAILLTVKASLMDGTLKELLIYTTKFNIHALEEHYIKSRRKVLKS